MSNPIESAWICACHLISRAWTAVLCAAFLRTEFEEKEDE